MKFIIKYLISSFGSKIYNLISYKYLHKKFSKKPPKIVWDNPSRFNQKIIWLKNLDELDKNPSIFVANEFFDALPIKQFIKKKNNW